MHLLKYVYEIFSNASRGRKGNRRKISDYSSYFTLLETRIQDYSDSIEKDLNKKSQEWHLDFQKELSQKP